MHSKTQELADNKCSINVESHPSIARVGVELGENMEEKKKKTKGEENELHKSELYRETDLVLTLAVL